MVTICELLSDNTMSQAVLPEPKAHAPVPLASRREKTTSLVAPKPSPAAPVPSDELLRVPRLTVLVPLLTEPVVSLMLSVQVLELI